MQCSRGVCYHEINIKPLSPCNILVQIQVKFSEIIQPSSTWWRETAEQTGQVQPNEASGYSRCAVKMDINNGVNEAKSTFQRHNKPFSYSL